VKKVLVIVVMCGILGAICVVMLRERDTLQSNARRAWKEKAIAGISFNVEKPSWPNEELTELRRKNTEQTSDSDGWLSERIIVMENGEWLAYTNVCQKEDSRIRDLFLARGSDGRWYFSTFHFCKQMIVLRMEEQSTNLLGFAETYYLRSFDGRSDECLQKTWPPGSR
jgi:hypothetical protein